ncbi:MAG: tetratricopeptide repeat protein [Cyanobacteriota bacterium]
MKFKKRVLTLLTSLIVTLSFLPVASAFNLEAAQAYNKALDLYINSKTDLAIEQFKKAVTIDPEFADAYYNLGSIYRYGNQLEKAEEAFQKVLGLRPNDTSVNYDLALIYIQKNDLNRAISFLKLVNKTSDRYKDAQSKLSLIDSELKLMKTNNLSTDNTSNTTTMTINKESQSNLTVSKAIKETPAEKEPVKKNQEPDKTNVAKNKDITTSTEPEKVVNIKKEPNKRSKRLRLSKKERSELSQSIATTNFLDKKEIHNKVENNNNLNDNKVVETLVPEQNNNDYWEKYSKTNDEPKELASNNVKDEDIAISYMAIEDADYNKLKLSPKNALYNNNSETSKPRSNSSRSAIKTFATGFNGPTGIVQDKNGNFFIANYSENKIYKVTPSGQKTVFAGTEDINGPIGLAIDEEGNIFVANYLSNSITKITVNGETSTVATGLNKPYFLYLDNSGNLFVSEQDTNTISMIDLTNGKRR